MPILIHYRFIPYASFITFFGLYLGVVRNPNFSQYMRFNSIRCNGFGFKLMVWGYNVMFVFSCFCFVLVSCVMGKTPYLPFVADATGGQM
ncbi:hypothetical protein K2173_013824 [Erythroxylum novogranatense]|uniref:Protein TIC 20 n=1 Tax=Erythroxylum novogranatense TaxID=1862640 RepID=A0AAV8SCY7_9ROSI|nr:hypothetical protein K2173_013824 [Erythroxylum novogranatense]